MKAGLAFVALGFTLPAGCAWVSPAERPPLVAPQLETSTAYYTGTSLTGPIAKAGANAIDDDPAHAIACACRIVYVERFDETWLASLANRSRLVLTSTAGEPFQSTSSFAPRARVGSDRAAREFLSRLENGAKLRSVPVAAEDAAIPPGVTVVFSCAAAAVTLEDGHVAERSADVEISNADGALRVALVLAGPIARSVGGDAEEGAKVVRTAGREAILLEDEPKIDGDPLVLIYPAEFSGGGAFVAVINAASAPADEPAATEHRERVASALTRLGVVGVSARDRARELSRREAWSSQVGKVRRDLEDPARRRAALVFLGTSTGAELVEDAAYSASDADLAELATIASSVTRDEPGADESGHERALGWALERRFYERFAKQVSDETLAPDLCGVLLRHCGECGRWADTIQEGLRRARNADQLLAHFVRENRIFLEDSAPGSRVRAYDWLASRGLAPEGFDPLAPEAERRRVILALEAAAEVEAK